MTDDRLIAALICALRGFVDYYDQGGIGPCHPADDDDPPDGFDGDEVFNVRQGRAALRLARKRDRSNSPNSLTR